MLRLFLAFWVSWAYASSPLPPECLSLDERLAEALGQTGLARPATDGETISTAGTTAEPAPSVRDALAWEKAHGRLDFLLADGASTTKPVPKFATAGEAQDAHDRLANPYSRLLLATHARDLLPEAQTRQLEAARAVLRSHFEKPPAFYGEAKETEEVIAALATLARLGSPADKALVEKAGKWAEWFPETFKVIERRMTARKAPDSGSTTREIREFVDAVFKDVAAERPDVAIHQKHSERVADLVVELRRAQLEKEGGTLGKEDAEALWVAAYAHDLGKALWPKALLAKRSRLSEAEYKAAAGKIAGAGLKFEEAREVLRILKTMNGEISPEHPDPVKPSDADLTTLRRLGILTEGDKKGVLSAEETSLLLSDRVNLSQAERALVNEHVGGYRILMALAPGGLAPKLAQVHHELLNGTGYPFGLKAGELDPLARIITVADIFDAVTGPRPNTPGGAPPEQGLAVLRNPYHKERVDQKVVDLLEAVLKARGTASPRAAVLK